MAGLASSNLQGGLAYTILAHHSLQISLVQQQCWLRACPVIPSAFLQTEECHLTSLQGQQAGRGLLLHLNSPKHPLHKARPQSSHAAQGQNPKSFAVFQKEQKVVPCAIMEAEGAIGESPLRTDPPKHQGHLRARYTFILPSKVSKGLTASNTHL